MQCHTSVPRTLGLFVLAIGMTVFSYLVALRGSGVEVFAGWAGVVLFGLAGLVLVAQLFRRSPSVVIDAEGFSAVRVGGERFSWARVASVSVRETRGQRFLCVWLRDEAAYVSSVSLRRHVLAKANAALGFPAITVSFQGLSPGLDEAYEYIKTVAPELADA